MAVSIPWTFSPGGVIFASQHNANNTSIKSWGDAHEIATTGVHGVGAGAIVGTTLSQTLTNKALTSAALTTPTLAGAGAGKATLQYANSANNRTLTVPDPGANAGFVLDQGTYTIAGVWTSGGWTIAGIPNFTGNVLFSGAPILNAPTIGMIDKGNSGAGTVTCDCLSGSKFLITATGNFTLAFSNFQNGQRVEVWILQDGTGSRTVTWPAVTRWLNGSGATNSTTDAPTLTTTANKFDVISFEKFDAVGTDGNLYAFIRGFKGAIT